MSPFYKNTVDNAYYELSKKIKKRFKGLEVSIFVVGGAAILHHCAFRESTMDIDVIKDRNIDLRDLLLELEETKGFPHNWLNDSVMFSSSFCKGLRKYCKFYKTFYSCLHVYVIVPVALVCMKLKANRLERNDLLDALSICCEHDLSFENIKYVYEELYGNDLPEVFSVVERLFRYFTEYKVAQRDRLSELNRLYSLGDLDQTLKFLLGD